jgi:NAD(P)-dependent dehydrogenase (short-subunit alcohol dehydrogenase family)
MTNTDAHSPIQTPYGFASTAAEVVAGVDLKGRRAIVTGGGSGIGIETARALAGAGAEVTLAVRDLVQGERVATELGADRVGAATLDLADLADLASVDAFVAGWEGPLDILVCDAGVMMLPRLTLTAAGAELQFATNHLGHMALAIGLHDALAAAASARGDARVAVVSSVGHLLSRVVFDDIQFSARPYDPALAYGQSKTAEILFAVQANRDWARDGITVDALHPGAILETGLAPHIDPTELGAIVESGVFDWKTRSRARRRRCSSPPGRRCAGSAVATSRTATKLPWLTPRLNRTWAQGSPDTRLTPTTPRGCGTSPSRCCGRRAADRPARPRAPRTSARRSRFSGELLRIRRCDSP